MNFDDNIYATPVFDGKTINVPVTRMGLPRGDQLQGTNLERLCELAGRVCYDSLGKDKARGSAEYHAHILEVGHLSVLEHATFTVAFREDPDRLTAPPDPNFYYPFLPVLVNRPGVWLETDKRKGFKALRVTCNLRAIREWGDWLPHVESNFAVFQYLGWSLMSHAHRLAPQIVPDPGRLDPEIAQHSPYLATLVTNNPNEPQWNNEDERWISLLVGCSRGCSHELVRHGDFTAISQRSTRFLDEDESPWVEHPLVAAFGSRTGTTMDSTSWLVEAGISCEAVAQDVYRSVKSRLETWLLGCGVGTHTARKQARGAARGFLGNALYTELIFSANVAQWKRMLRARCSNPADAEIRVLFARVFAALLRTQHAECFKGMHLVPADDGIGEVIAGG